MKQTSKMLVVIAVLLSTVTSQAKYVEFCKKEPNNFKNTNTESVGINQWVRHKKRISSLQFSTPISVKDALVSSNGNDAAGKAKQMLLAG